MHGISDMDAVIYYANGIAVPIVVTRKDGDLHVSSNIDSNVVTRAQTQPDVLLSGICC